MINLTFKEWLLYNERSYVGLRPDMDVMDTKKEEIQIGDIVELGPETKLKGEKVGRIGKITEKGSDFVKIQDLTRANNKKLIVPIVNLYNKEDLKGRTLLPSEERQLRALGGRTLWVFLTPRQYKKFKTTYKAPELPEIIPASKEDEPSDVLKSMFNKKEIEAEPETTVSIFKDKAPGEQQPLRRFLASRRGIF